MTSERPYCDALAPSEALAEVLRCSGSQFWPDAVAALEVIYRAGALHDLEPDQAPEPALAGCAA